MGGRSSASGAGGGSGHVRTGRDQLPRTNNDDAWHQMQRDTGYDDAQTQAAFDAMIEFYGGPYEKYTAGRLPDATRIATEAALRMPYYNGAEAYRGVEMLDSVADRVFLDKWKPNTEQMFTDTRGQGKAILQSFSSDRYVSQENFGNWSYVNSGYTSILFIMHDNRTAPGVQHISKFGTGEAEVLSPAGQRFKVLSVEHHAPSRLGGRRVMIHLQDLGWKEPNY